MMKSNTHRHLTLSVGLTFLFCAALALLALSRASAQAGSSASGETLLPAYASATVWTVNTTADSGSGSLREALAGAGANARIEFDPSVFPPDNPGTIMVLTELPSIEVDGLTIDAVGRGVILDGSNAPSLTDGLTIEDTTNGVTIQGLQVLRFPKDGIVLKYGVSNALIGGDRLAGEGNVISGNGESGISLIGVGTSSNVIAGNIVGADNAGMASMPNDGDGIAIKVGASHNTIGGVLSGYGNLVSGNKGHGIWVVGNGTDHNVILGNLIGTDLTGVGVMGNDGSGVVIEGGPDDTLVGGDTPQARNVIAGNGGTGVWVHGISTDDTVVQGNYIGTDLWGTHALSNHAGVRISGGSKRSLVGGETVNLRNVISGNRTEGVLIGLPGTRDNEIKGNYIGTDLSGAVALPNGGSGVEIIDNAQDNVIGGVSVSALSRDGSQGGCEGDCNLISGNLGNGVYIRGSGTTGNVILGNYIGAGWQGDKTSLSHEERSWCGNTPSTFLENST